MLRCASPGDLSGDSSASDAGADIASGEAGAVDNDAAVRGDAAVDAARFCSATHAVCDDFNDGPLGGAWSSVERTSPDLLGLVTDKWVSPPRALRSATTTGTAGLVKSVGQSVQSVDCRVNYQLVSGPRAQLFKLEFTDTAGDYASFDVYLGLGSASVLIVTSSLADGASGYQPFTVGAVPSKTWLRVRFVVSFSPSGDGTLTLTVDDTQLLSERLAGPRGAKLSKIWLGEDNDNGTPYEALFDDVVCDVK